MQLFMRSIPAHTRPDDLEIALARYLHRPPFSVKPPLNFHIAIFKGKPGSRYRCGILTLPDPSVGELFLRLYGQDGIVISSNDLSRVQFSANNRPPDIALIALVASNSWQDPELLQKEKEKRQADSGGIPLESFAFGRLCRDRSFSAEVTHLDGEDSEDAIYKIACDMTNRRIVLSITAGLFSVPRLAWYRASQVIATCSPPSTAGPHNVILEASAAPVFEERSIIQLFDDNQPSQRVESIFGNQPMPSVGRFLCLTFATRDYLDTFLQRCKALHLRRHLLLDIPIGRYKLYSSVATTDCQGVLLRLPFALAFEVDKAIHDGILDPKEALELEFSIKALLADQGDEAPAIFRSFLSRIRAPSFVNFRRITLKDIQSDLAIATKKRRRNRRHRGGKGQRKQLEPLVEEPLPDPTFADLLGLFAKSYAPEHPRQNRLIMPTAASYEAYHLILTPSSRVLEGPLPDQSSSMLRNYGNHECFLRVTFQDDNRVTLRQDTTLNISIKELLSTRYKRALINGLDVAGRNFEFLGYSMSGLKEHSVFFVHPFQFDLNGVDTLMTAEVIRSQLGDFSMIDRKPALLAARWAQAFTVSAPSVQLSPNEVLPIEDRKSPSGSLFTDGCSPISSKLCREIWKKLKPLSNNTLIPSCYQIRVGGAKGVIFEDPTLRGKVLCLRKSQTKFETNAPLTLNIASTSARPIRMFLNRPLIMLLEHLGVRDESFIKLQNDAIADVDRTRTSFKAASKLFQQHGLGASFRLSSLFNNLVKQLRLSDDDVSSQRLGCELITTSVAYAATHVLREIKFRGRIAVPGSFTLIGVSDEWGCLEEGEIYATVRDERRGLYQPIEGKVLITRSPQIHPGDVQFVTAVRPPQLAHLNNVVVFSCKGERSLPSCLGGGDLDGDIYNIIIDETLFPTRTVEPGSYRGLPHKETVNPCTVSDVADFVIDFLEADLVGMIANRHLCIADVDEKGPECKDCLLLAEYASHAVDFPKTGTAVNFNQLPRSPNRLKPDFLSNEVTDVSTLNTSFYPSKKILGHLYRRVPLQDDEPEDRSASFGIIAGAVDALRTERLGLPSVFDLPEDVLQEMGDVLELYKTELQFIAKAHTLAKHPNDQLSEAELVSGTIQAKWADHHKRRETVTSMNLQTQQLTKGVRRVLRKVEATEAEQDDEDDEDEDDDERLTNRDIESFVRSAAAWTVALEDLEAKDGPLFGTTSFGLIGLGVMLDVVKKAKKL